MSTCYGGHMSNNNDTLTIIQFKPEGFSISSGTGARAFKSKAPNVSCQKDPVSVVNIPSVQEVVTPFYVVSYYIKRFPTSWTYSSLQPPGSKTDKRHKSSHLFLLAVGQFFDLYFRVVCEEVNLNF